MSKPFFLTRQSANLLEDFARETRPGPVLFLLYGDPGVGKTRLLQELKVTRLADGRVHWINLASEDPGTTPGDRSAKIEQLFESAQPGDIIIADHFEAALKKTRHQLFVSWSSHGEAKRLGLIIASSSDGFNELRQLSAQYQVRVQSSQLMPLGGEEVDAFLGFYLFPDHPIGKLSMPKPLRKRIAAARGVIGELIDIADEDGSQISTRPQTDNESIRQGSRVIVSVMVLFALAAGIAWYLFGSRDSIPRPDMLVDMAEPKVDTAEPTAADPEPAVAETVAPEVAPTPDDESIITTDEVQQPLMDEVALETVAIEAPIVDNDPELVAAAAPEIDTPAPVASEAPAAGEPAAAVTDDAMASAVTVETSSGPLTDAQRLLRDLQASLDWIYARNETIGFIQILLLSYDNFDVEGYYAYLSRLEANGVDLSRVRIFKTLTGSKVFYSVLYGEYDSRNDANLAIGALPRILRDARPIPRSVGGIWEEMQRLDATN